MNSSIQPVPILIIVIIMWATTMFILVNLYNDNNDRHDAELEERGKAIAAYLDYTMGINVPPEQAQFIEITATQWNVTIKDLDVFGSFKDMKRRK